MGGPSKSAVDTGKRSGQSQGTDGQVSLGIEARPAREPPVVGQGAWAVEPPPPSILGLGLVSRCEVQALRPACAQPGTLPARGHPQAECQEGLQWEGRCQCERDRAEVLTAPAARLWQCLAAGTPH